MFSCSIPFLGIPILSDDNPVEKVSLNFQQPEQKRHCSYGQHSGQRHALRGQPVITVILLRQHDCHAADPSGRHDQTDTQKHGVCNEKTQSPQKQCRHKQQLHNRKEQQPHIRKQIL